ncbi:MAG: hypothetical protein U0269_22140 [Polyangiales bacterium]
MSDARRWLLCAEDSLSATLARDLCDRVIRERARFDWLRELWDPSLVDTQRAWIGLDPHFDWADRGAVDRRCEARSIASAVRDVATGRRVAPHAKAAMAFRSARAAMTLDPPPDLLFIAADTDGETDPRMLFDEGLRLADEPITAVCAEIHRESEAWVVAGFVAQNTHERDALARVCDELGFDPTLECERLMSDLHADVRDAKRVAKALFESSGGVTARNPRFAACWQDTALSVLEARGQRSGLARYLRAVETVVVDSLVR